MCAARILPCLGLAVRVTGMGLIVDSCLSPEQHRLRDQISQVSEACLYAGWASETEFAVWRLATEGGSWGRCSATELKSQLNEIKALAHALGEWVVWSDRADCDNEPVDLAQWRIRYDEWRATQA